MPWASGVVVSRTSRLFGALQGMPQISVKREVLFFCQTQFDHIKAVFWNIYPIHRVGLSEMFLLIVIAVLFPSCPFCWIGSRCFALSIDSWATSYCDVDMATMSLWGQALPPGVRFHPAPQKDIYCIHLPTPGIRHAPFWGEIPSSANHKSFFARHV